MAFAATHRFLQIGLTGGIGSGKSTVATILSDHGAAVVDADAVSRSVTASGGTAIPDILERFGASAVDADGAMNREFMRGKVFSDPAARAVLEGIIHPLVSMECTRQATAAADAGRSCVVFDIPLLVESAHWRSKLDHVVVIDCLESTQINRVMARNGWAAADVQKVIDAQASRSRRLAAADVCIYNDSISLAQLQLFSGALAKRFGL